MKFPTPALVTTSVAAIKGRVAKLVDAIAGFDKSGHFSLKPPIGRG
ncbi:hypothetical protein NKI79_19975 [Mesorhizobium sp. M0340]